jgi:hypothetical protein
MWGQVGQLYAYHGDVPAEVRLLKLTERSVRWPTRRLAAVTERAGL